MSEQDLGKSRINLSKYSSRELEIAASVISDMGLQDPWEYESEAVEKFSINIGIQKQIAISREQENVPLKLKLKYWPKRIPQEELARYYEWNLEKGSEIYRPPLESLPTTPTLPSSSHWSIYSIKSGRYEPKEGSKMTQILQVNRQIKVPDEFGYLYENKFTNMFLREIDGEDGQKIPIIDIMNKSTLVGSYRIDPPLLNNIPNIIGFKRTKNEKNKMDLTCSLTRLPDKKPHYALTLVKRVHS